MKKNMHPTLWASILAVLSLTACPALFGAETGQAVDDYNFAAWLYNTGKYPLAIESYEKFLRNYPGHEKGADARFGLAQSHFHLNAFAKAAEQYEAIRADHPAFPQRAEVLFQLGQSRVALEQFEPAESLFNEVAEKHGDHYLADWAIARRAACLTSLGRNADAEALLTPFLARYTADKRAPVDVPATKDMLKKLDDAGVKAGAAFVSLIERSVFTLALTQFNQERFPDAEKSFLRFLTQFADSSLAAEARFRLAQSLYRQGSFAAAAETYASLASADGEFASVSAFERGLSLYKAGNLKPASDAFADMAARFPADERAPKASLYAGTFLYETADYAGAIARLQPLVDAGKAFADEAAYWVAMALLRQNRLPEAREAFTRAIAAYPRSALAGDMRLGLADTQLAAGDLQAASSSFEAYAKDNPKADQAPRALYSSAVALHRADLFERSDKLCKTFLDRFGKDALVPDVLFLSGENRFLANDPDGAATRYGEFLARKDAAGDRVPRAHFRLAWIHRGAKRLDQALDAIAKIDRQAAGDVVAAEADYLAGICHFDLAAYDKAIERLEAYLKAPDHNRFGDDALLKTGMAWHRRGNAKQAVAALKRLLKEYAGSDLATHAQFQLAERCAELKDHAEAVKHYLAVSEREGAGDLAPFALFGLGVAHADQARWADAAAAFGRLVERFPDSELRPQALYRRGRALVSAAQWVEASAAFVDLIAAAPKHELARSAQVNAAACFQELKDWTKAAESYKAAIENFAPGDDQARLYYELAWAHREAGRADAALGAFRALAEKYPKDPLAADAFFHLAEDAYKANESAPPAADEAARARRLDEARQLYEQAIAASQDKRLLDKAIYRIGWCWWQTGRYAESAAAFDRLIDECPRSDLLPDALFQSGLAHARIDERELARKRMERLTEEAAYATFPYRADALLALGDYRLGAGEHDAAIAALDSYLATFADHHDVARAHLLKGKALYGLKRYADATAALEAATRLTRSAVAAEAQFYIGQTHQIQSNFKEAIVAYLRVQALYPGEAEWGGAATFELAKCYEALGQADDAKATLKDVVSRYKDTQWAKLAEARLK